MYQYILFDLDGTLTDPKEGITKCVQYALKYFGIEADTEDLVDFIGPPLLESFQKYYHLDDEQGHMALKKYRERFSDIGIFENGVYPGIAELLPTLKAQGRKIALATSKPGVYAKRILERYELLPYFDVLWAVNWMAAGQIRVKLSQKHSDSLRFRRNRRRRF